MSPDTKIKLAELSELTIGQLAARYEKLFGEKCRSRNRRYVYRRVAWKMQAEDEGGLSERAILRATVVARESLLRVAPPKARKSKKEVPASIPANWDIRIPPVASGPSDRASLQRQTSNRDGRQRHRNGESLFRTNREDRALYEAAKHWHGSWTAALEAAGFPRPPRDFYTPDEVRLRIIDLYERALPLTFQSHNDVKLQRSCKKHFGGWRQAVESLRLGSELRRMWTDHKVIESIILRRARGFDLGATRYEDHGLFVAARVRFGSWNKALTAAGINLANVTRHRPKNLDRDAMRLWIRNRKEAGQSITFSEVCLENRDFALAIKREFRSWARALEAAFPPQESSAD